MASLLAVVLCGCSPPDSLSYYRLNDDERANIKQQIIKAKREIRLYEQDRRLLETINASGNNISKVDELARLMKARVRRLERMLDYSNPR